MYLIFLLLYVTLCLCQWRALFLIQQPRMLPRQKLLTCIIVTKTAGLVLQSINVVVFAYDGRVRSLCSLLFLSFFSFMNFSSSGKHITVARTPSILVSASFANIIMRMSCPALSYMVSCFV